jgi:hypothetical protein
VWVTAIIMFTIPAIYYLVIVGNLGANYVQEWVVAFRGLLAQPAFYIRWMTVIHVYFDLALMLIGLGSTFFLPKRGRVLVVCFWIGYLLIGMSVPSLIISHDYYNLSLIPVIALSLAPLGQLFLDKILQQSKPWRVAFIAVLALCAAYPAWIARNRMVAVNYRDEILGWIKMGQEIPKDANILGITHDYNTRIRYYGWVSVAPWPLAGDEQMHILSGGNSDLNDPYWEDFFNKTTQGYDYFLLTNPSELQAQPVLKRMLEQYPVIEGEGYWLYDLR